MSTAVMMQRIKEASPRFKVRLAGLLYLLTFLTWLLVNGVEVQRWNELAGSTLAIPERA